MSHKIYHIANDTLYITASRNLDYLWSVLWLIGFNSLFVYEELQMHGSVWFIVAFQFFINIVFVIKKRADFSIRNKTIINDGDFIIINRRRVAKAKYSMVCLAIEANRFGRPESFGVKLSTSRFRPSILISAKMTQHAATDLGKSLAEFVGMKYEDSDF